MHDRFLRACRRQPTDCTPVWFMRQAGRYMPEYRRLREQHSFMEMTKTPELAAQITLQPVRAFPVDAAIIYSDILLPLEPMGAQLEYAAGEGPVIHNPVRSPADVEALRLFEPDEELSYVSDAIQLVKANMPRPLPLIGFAGAPFTLASYLIEGGASKNYVETKRVMYHHPAAWHSLLEKLATVVACHLRAQVYAGADALQVFDSWVGCLSPSDYREYVLPHSRSVFQTLGDLDLPLIHFGTGTAALLPLMREAGGDVIGLDWRVYLADAWQILGEVAVQGNLDPVALFAPRDELERRVRAVLDQAAGRPGHIFNLGHGILPGTPVEHVRLVTDLVHEMSQRTSYGS